MALGVPRMCAKVSDDARAHVPRRDLAAAPARHQAGVHLAKQAVAERKTLPETGHAMLQRGDVVGDFGDVVERRAARCIVFEEEEFRERRLRAFDL